MKPLDRDVLRTAKRFIRRGEYPAHFLIFRKIGLYGSSEIARSLKRMRESGQLVIPPGLRSPESKHGVEDVAELYLRAARVREAGRILGRNLKVRELFQVLPD